MTATHLTLFDVAPLPHEATLDERFAAFIAANPHALAHFRDLALPILANGRRTSMKALVEQARYSHAAFAPVGSDFKIDNSIVSRLSRALMERYPELRDAFVTRALASERAA